MSKEQQLTNCPACGAKKGEACRGRRGQALKKVHAARIEKVRQSWAMAYCANEFYSVGPEGACRQPGCETCGGPID